MQVRQMWLGVVKIRSIQPCEANLSQEYHLETGPPARSRKAHFVHHRDMDCLLAKKG